MTHETIRDIFSFANPQLSSYPSNIEHRTLRAKVKLLMKLFVSNYYTASQYNGIGYMMDYHGKYVYKHAVDRLQFIKFRDSFSYSLELLCSCLCCAVMYILYKSWMVFFCSLGHIRSCQIAR